ncbi:Energy-coupling factor transporter transmembrane protein EcfT [Carnimonas sp. R-84981]|uniref:energy-coupling factor transporter transmembrane component T family protein n=1 Tax=Carnimonas bestiolae TaxID=3402172 RepID=UPI003EDC8309
MSEGTLGYRAGDSVFHRLSGASKLLALVLIFAITMSSFDTRLLVAIVLLSCVALRVSRVRLHSIRTVLVMMLVVMILNLLVTWLFAPEYGVALYRSRTLLVGGVGRFTITAEQLFYEFNLLLKYVCTIPLALIFLLTTHPSEFASSLNRIGVSYRISYAVALAMRYIPALQSDYQRIRLAQQARGVELSHQAPLGKRVRGNVRIGWTLVVNSLQRITTISHAMELRRFGTNRSRSWYSATSLRGGDIALVVASLGIVVVGLWLFWLNHGRFYNPFVTG